MTAKYVDERWECRVIGVGIKRDWQKKSGTCSADMHIQHHTPDCVDFMPGDLVVVRW
jgi:hypothetical protein